MQVDLGPGGIGSLDRAQPVGRGWIAPIETGRTSALYLAVVGGLAAVSCTGGDRGVGRPGPLAVAGALTLLVLLGASARLRSHPAPSWMASQRDPFLAFAGAVAVLLLPTVAGLASSGSTRLLLDGDGWVTGGAAALFAGAGFLVMIRDMTPGRALDALFLAAIAAASVGLVLWVLAQRLIAAGLVSDGPAMVHLGPALLDLVVVGLGLQALHLRTGARRGCWCFLLAWTLVLVVEASELLASMQGGHLGGRPVIATTIVSLGLLGAAALHPDSTRAAEPVFVPLSGLPWSEVSLLAGAVVLGPGLAVVVGDPGSLPLLLAFSAALSLLVVIHLVRLVQGRAVFEHRAHHDELTGLANRTLFEDRASVAMAHARRTGGHCAVLFLDLDRFKNVNDSLGHAVGNLLLQAVAKRLRAVTRAEDTVARLGGDEFVVFLPELSEPGDAATVAAQIIDAFGEPFQINGHRLFASPSIGVAVFPGDATDADTMLKNADRAMYRAKQRGRRTFCTYDHTMNDHTHERLALESRLHTAIERQELRLHYQPKVSLSSGKVMGMEALLRWEHPEQGLLEPAAFISLAEESGLIVPLGAWALEEACRQNQAWQEAGFPPLVVAVNLSLRQFQQQSIGDLTARVLRSTGLDPALLELEVTESLAMQDPDDIRSTLADLRDMGVLCSIDDFGTGYSGLSHLTRLPVDKLKIDKSFVATIETDREAPIVVAVVALAHGLGLEVVAEGVETPMQLERLEELGCDEMQGYYFSRPIPPERFEQLLMLESIAPGPGRLLMAPRLVRVAG